MLTPGSYRVACPNTYTGPYGYVYAPGAVDLSNTTGVTFGAASPSAPATIYADYLGAGCPAVGATDARDVVVTNLLLDTQRLPFTDCTVADVSSDGRTLQLKMVEPERTEWDLAKYPWLGTVADNHDSPLQGLASSSWDATSGVATLKFSAPHSVKSGTHLFWKHFANMPAWGVYGLRVQGAYTLDHVQLLSAGGMGIRCDFCNGTYTMQSSAVRPGAGRAMSTTVTRHDIAAIWVAFFSRCQRYR